MEIDIRYCFCLSESQIFWSIEYRFNFYGGGIIRYNNFHKFSFYLTMVYSRLGVASLSLVFASALAQV